MQTFAVLCMPPSCAWAMPAPGTACGSTTSRCAPPCPHGQHVFMPQAHPGIAELARKMAGELAAYTLTAHSVTEWHHASYRAGVAVFDRRTCTAAVLATLIASQRLLAGEVSWSCLYLCWQATDAAEKSRAMRALAYAASTADVRRTLEYALNPEVKSQDIRTLLVLTAARSSANLQAAWDFVSR